MDRVCMPASAAGPIGLFARELWGTDAKVTITMGAEIRRPSQLEIDVTDEIRVGGRMTISAKASFSSSLRSLVCCGVLPPPPATAGPCSSVSNAFLSFELPKQLAAAFGSTMRFRLGNGHGSGDSSGRLSASRDAPVMHEGPTRADSGASQQ
jgi:hypothetical protein